MSNAANKKFLIKSDNQTGDGRPQDIPIEAQDRDLAEATFARQYPEGVILAVYKEVQRHV